MSRDSKRLRARLEDRAGTKIDYETPIHYLSPDGPVCHGFLDKGLGIFQGGGERTEIINYRHNPPLLSLMRAVWRDLLRIAQESGQDLTTWHWEMIDHTANVVYRISFYKVLKVGVEYRTEAGKRVGVAVKYLDISDADGRRLQTGEPVPPPPNLVFGEVDPSLYVMPSKRRSK